ncbi:MAG TPA: aldo/keto reductase [Chloroflexota bacterium]|nr:aldo/keto reductase [Chloroflexota bacterium]
MQTRTLGRTGLVVSAIGFGGAPLGLTNYLSAYDPRQVEDRDTAITAILRAIELGITYFDTALAYGDGESERILGEARRRAAQRGLDIHSRMLLATKVPSGKRTYQGVIESAETSLRNLGVDRLDVLQLHGSAWRDDEAENVLTGGALDALQELKRRGVARWIGFTSETCSPGTYRLVRSDAFDVLQIAYSILYQDACNLMIKAGPIVEARERQMGVVTMRSLTSGVFQKLVSQALPTATEQAHEIALKYVLSNPYVDCPLTGMRTAAEVEQNVAIASDPTARFDLTELHRRYV